ncbi:MAG TPA: hypothetical protein VG841_05400 [Caulobacterales bacterium]|nr:hypothetical protein [Caulobacterales bacterium]
MARMLRGIAAVSLALALSVGSGAAQPAPTQTQEMQIYGNTLQAGWSNWSWATVTLSFVISDPAETPIKVQAGPWQALYFQHAPFNTHGYSTFTFFVHGGARGGQDLQVIALDTEGHAIPNTAAHVMPAANDWSGVNISLADLNAVDKEVSGFWIQNATPGDANRFYVNYVSLN